jgi:DMSO/TMAO reductase YedYZ molybdopterin-dependent catalytic subunit
MYPSRKTMNDSISRRRFLARSFGVVGGLLLAGCDRLSNSRWFARMLAVTESLNEAVKKGTATRLSMAQEFSELEPSPSFRSNGTSRPSNAEYERLAGSGFADYRLQVGGLVATPLSLSLEEVRALPSRTQITRHDCVEGWSAIGKWKGARLSALLQRAQPSNAAKYVVFYCADSLEEDGDPYYESIDMDDAYHEQTLLAYELNDAVLPIENGAPLRLRVERQLGYKMAKYVMRIELVDKLDDIGGGRGGYWEDQGYQWYAGI